MNNNKINLKKFIPRILIVPKSKNKYPLLVEDKESYFLIRHTTSHFNNSRRHHSLIIPKSINRNKETFEVLGLLQAEMGKTNNGCIVFANSEYKLVNKVISWLEKELEINHNTWKWYIRINLQEPKDVKLKQELTEKMKNYWIKHTKINPNNSHPKALCFVKDTKNKTPKNHGTLMIEYKMNSLSHIIKKYVKYMSYNMPYCNKEEIQAFMRAIIAGEGCVEIDNKYKKYRVCITAIKQVELDLFENCLRKLEIPSKQYQGDTLIISRKENLLKLLEQRLMTLSPEKYAKFRNMMLKYQDIRDHTNYFRPKGTNIWNKTPQEKIDDIIKLSKKDLSSKEIAQKLNLHILKVHRVRKEHNLGNRTKKPSPEKIQEIIETHNRLHFLHAHQIANQSNIHVSCVQRIRKKHKLAKNPIKHVIKQQGFRFILNRDYQKL